MPVIFDSPEIRASWEYSTIGVVQSPHKRTVHGSSPCAPTSGDVLHEGAVVFREKGVMMMIPAYPTGFI